MAISISRTLQLTLWMTLQRMQLHGPWPMILRVDSFQPFFPSILPFVFQKPDPFPWDSKEVFLERFGSPGSEWEGSIRMTFVENQKGSYGALMSTVQSEVDSINVSINDMYPLPPNPLSYTLNSKPRGDEGFGCARTGAQVPKDTDPMAFVFRKGPTALVRGIDSRFVLRRGTSMSNLFHKVAKGRLEGQGRGDFWSQSYSFFLKEPPEPHPMRVSVLQTAFLSSVGFLSPCSTVSLGEKERSSITPSGLEGIAQVFGQTTSRGSRASNGKYAAKTPHVSEALETSHLSPWRYVGGLASLLARITLATLGLWRKLRDRLAKTS